MQSFDENESIFKQWTPIYLGIVQKLSEKEANLAGNNMISALFEVNKLLFSLEDKQQSQAELQSIVGELDSITAHLEQNGLTGCRQVIRPVQDKLKALILRNAAKGMISPFDAVKEMIIPADILIEGIAPHSSIRSLLNLATTCTFFANHSNLKSLIKNKKSRNQIAAGNKHMIILYEGSLFVFGYNDSGQLGLGHTRAQLTPQKLTLPEGNTPRQVATGTHHTPILCQEGSLFVFGYNGSGQLGLDDTEDQLTPQKLTLPEGNTPRQVAAGIYHTLILCQEGSLFVFGGNGLGQLGLGHTKDQLTPQKLTLPEGNTPHQVAAGGYHTLILCQEGSLFIFGDNRSGQLGLGHKRDQVTTPQKLTLPEGNTPRQVAAGTHHTLILCQEGSLFVFGDIRSGQLGLGHTGDELTTPQKLTLQDGEVPYQMAAGAEHTLILCQDNSIFVFGGNSCGQLGLNDYHAQHAPKELPSFRMLSESQLKENFNQLIEQLNKYENQFNEYLSLKSKTQKKSILPTKNTDLFPPEILQKIKILKQDYLKTLRKIAKNPTADKVSLKTMIEDPNSLINFKQGYLSSSSRGLAEDIIATIVTQDSTLKTYIDHPK